MTTSEGYLLDTMVISEAGKRQPSQHVAAWLKRIPREAMFLSVISIREVERGIALAEARDGRYATRLRAWLDETIFDFGDRVLPITAPIARLCGRMEAKAGRGGNDALIAATAAMHGLAVATRNVRDFAPLDVDVFNPYGDAI